MAVVKLIAPISLLLLLMNANGAISTSNNTSARNIKLLAIVPEQTVVCNKDGDCKNICGQFCPKICGNACPSWRCLQDGRCYCYCRTISNTSAMEATQLHI